MPRIEIGTSQNVGIHYDAANVAERIIAALIDVAVSIGIIVGFLIVRSYLNKVLPGIANLEIATYFFYLLLIAIAMYPFICESLFDGRTMGKHALRIRVMRLDGTQARIADYFLRWLIGIAEIGLSAGSIAAVAIIVSKNSQRIGDLAAGTTVVRLAKRVTLAASFLDAADATGTVMYPEVHRLRDADISTIRNVLSAVSARAVNNKTATALVWSTKEKLEDVLGVHTSMQPQDFLYQILHDYSVIFDKDV